MCNSYTNDKGISFSQSIEIFDAPGLMIEIAEQMKSKGYKVRNIFHGSCFYAEKEFHQVINSENFRKKLDKGVFDYDEMKEGENLMVTIQNPERYCRKVKAIKLS